MKSEVCVILIYSLFAGKLSPPVRDTLKKVEQQGLENFLYKSENFLYKSFHHLIIIFSEVNAVDPIRIFSL